LADVAAAAARVTPVPGRMQRVPGLPGEPELVVDYAHTPDALDKALAALRPLAAARGGRLCCVFGCGGNRDPSKRPLMGAIAARLADRVLVTSDNPRGEPPEAITAQIVAGLAPTDAAMLGVEVDRRRAIFQAVAEAAAQDVILIAGKGHEDYQEVAGIKLPFSDLDQAGAALLARRAG
jgi:UDP-N-acetylmuramoyl-L-alanyl-D-glutamate--2,6-diaminopimelate ligase